MHQTAGTFIPLPALEVKPSLHTVLYTTSLVLVRFFGRPGSGEGSTEAPKIIVKDPYDLGVGRESPESSATLSEHIKNENCDFF